MSKRNELGMPSDDYERLWNVWRNMLRRCYDPDCDRYYTYGARGIGVCQEWKENFRVFAKWAYENGWRRDLSIERKNPNEGYSPENCEFLTMKEQARNKTNNIRITIDGDERCLAEWCEIFGVPFGTAWARIKVGRYTDPEYIFYKGDLRSIGDLRSRRLHDVGF